MTTAPRFLASTNPSADLYLAWSCADLIEAGRIEVLAPTVFRAGGTLIVVRHLSGLRPIPQYDRLIHVVDDDWHGGILDRSLPGAYRLKLAMVECRDAWALERRADVFAVASQALGQRYGQRFPTKRVVRIDPAWPEPSLRAGSVFSADIAYLGSPAHSGDMPYVAEVIARTLSERPDLRVLIAGGHSMPAAWTARENIIQLPDLPWPDYWAWLQGVRAAVLLYPLGAGRFNAARSINKLMEADQVGAALLGSARWTAGISAAARGQCRLPGDSPADWCQAVLDLLDHPQRALDLVRANRAALAEQKSLVGQRALWQGLLWGEGGN